MTDFIVISTCCSMIHAVFASGGRLGAFGRGIDGRQPICQYVGWLFLWVKRDVLCFRSWSKRHSSPPRRTFVSPDLPKVLDGYDGGCDIL